MIAFAVLVALQATVAPAAPGVVSGATATAVPAAKPAEKLICQEEDTLGTRLGGHKRCMTREQWREAYQQEREAVKHAQDNKGYQHY